MAELTVRADLIVDAVATGRDSLWIDGTLLTAIHLEILEVLKGESHQEITLLLPGGIDLDREIPVAVHWPGAPELATGERAVLFLHRSSEESLGEEHRRRGPYYSIVSLSQGKLSVHGEEGNLVAGDGSATSGDRRPLSSVKADIRRTLARRHREVR